MWKKVERYLWTLAYLKKSQIFYLIKNRLEGGKKAVTIAQAPAVRGLPLWIDQLDSCPEYRRRFPAEEILEGNVTLLYEQGAPGGKNWENASRSHLWNFNLHYLEFLIPLAAAYREKREPRYYECFRGYADRWILDNQEGSGDGWHPYTISLRLTNLWICMDGFEEILRKDTEFVQRLNDSMYAQYLHLQKKLERHLLGNHYFENLKAVVLGALYFQETAVFRRYERLLLKETNEQILPDGLHYERSLMYHKIILEDLIRVAKAAGGDMRGTLVPVMQRMADAAYSLEEGMGRTPLFNDAGDNVARTLRSLLGALKDEFGIMPKRRSSFPAAGYYCLQGGDLRLLLDAGQIAPDYMAGHGHCDGLSFELSLKGEPLFVNSGTGQYQGRLRSYFRSTAAHNTVLIDGREQSECWGEHRVGRRITDVSGGCGADRVEGFLKTCAGSAHKRSIRIKACTAGEELEIRDRVKGYAQAYFHLAPGYEYVEDGRKLEVRCQRTGGTVCAIRTEETDRIRIFRRGTVCSYAPEFGKTERIQVLEISWEGDGTEHTVRMRFPGCRERKG